VGTTSTTWSASVRRCVLAGVPLLTTTARLAGLAPIVLGSLWLVVLHSVMGLESCLFVLNLPRVQLSLLLRYSALVSSFSAFCVSKLLSSSLCLSSCISTARMLFFFLPLSSYTYNAGSRMSQVHPLSTVPVLRSQSGCFSAETLYLVSTNRSMLHGSQTLQDRTLPTLPVLRGSPFLLAGFLG